MDELHQRGQALENLFFKEKDEKLLDQLRARMAADEDRSALQAATGVTDTGTLDSLLQLGISAESLTSVSLIPLVEVAWSDGVVQDKERGAILDAATKSGIASGSPSFQLLEGWLQTKPGAELMEGWKAYIHSLKSTLDETAFSQLKNSILGRAKSVAEAAGGFLGLGNKISDSEDKVLSDLKSAFD